MLNSAAATAHLAPEEDQFIVERIIDCQIDNDVLKFKVRWAGYDPSGDTWEPPEHLQNCWSLVEHYFKRHPSKYRQWLDLTQSAETEHSGDSAAKTANRRRRRMKRLLSMTNKRSDPCLIDLSDDGLTDGDSTINGSTSKSVSERAAVNEGFLSVTRKTGTQKTNESATSSKQSGLQKTPKKPGTVASSTATERPVTKRSASKPDSGKHSKRSKAEIIEEFKKLLSLQLDIQKQKWMTSRAACDDNGIIRHTFTKAVLNKKLSDALPILNSRNYSLLNINRCDESGTTLLMRCCFQSCNERHEVCRSLEVLLANGADVNYEDASGNRPLMFACKKNSLCCVDLLLKYGADVNAVNRLGDTVLFTAVRQKAPELAKLLLKVGADSNIANAAGETATQLITKMGLNESFPELFGAQVAKQAQ